jgi:DNA-directed RNA polymerase sigma subunit (sigma70/sigma32)
MTADIRPASFNNPLSADSTDTLIDIYDGRSESPDKDVMESDIKEMLQTLAGELPPVSAEIVMRRHGIPGYAEEPESFTVIGEDIGLTSEAVRMRYMKALNTMKTQARKHNYKISDVF